MENKEDNKKKGLSFLNKLKNVKVEDLFKKKDDYEQVGSYENPEVKKESVEIQVDYTSAQIKKKNLAKIFAIFFIILAFIPKLFRLIDPTYEQEVEVVKNVKSRLKCIKDETFLEYEKRTTFEADYVDQKVKQVVILYQFYPLIEDIEKINFDNKEYEKLKKNKISGTTFEEAEKSFQVEINFKNQKVKEDLSFGVYGKMQYIMKNTLENETFKCTEEKTGGEITN